jgi:hypothetical protein
MTKEDLRLKFWNFFSNSSTVLWARFQILFGCVWFVASMTDMTPYLPAKYIPLWAVINGVITEYLRRVNAQKSTLTVDSSKGVVSNITYLKTAPPVPAGAKIISDKKAV